MHAMITKSQPMNGIFLFGPGCVNAENAMSRYAPPELNFAAAESCPNPGDLATINQGTSINKVTKRRLSLGMIKKASRNIPNGASNRGWLKISSI